MEGINFMRNHSLELLLVGFILIFFLLMSVGQMAWAQNGPPIVAIRVEGNNNINSQLILSAVSISLKEPFNQEKIKSDIKSIFDLGYFTKVWVDTKQYPDGIELIFKVEENQVLKEIKVQGNTQMSTEEIRSAMILVPGQVMNWKIFQNDLDRIKALYSNNGYMITAIGGTDFTSDGILKFTIHEGIVEQIKIEGTEKTKDYVILRELSFKTPTKFDFSEIKKSMRAVYNLGFFDDISMKIEPGSDPNNVIIVIKVIEKLTGEAGLGVGYNTEDGWLGFIRYQESNFGGNAQKLELRYEFGSRTLYRLYFEEPWLFDTPTYFSLSVYDQIRERKNREEGEIIGRYEEERVGGQVAFGRRFSDYWRWRLSYKTENIMLTALEGEVPNRGGLTNSLTPMIIYDTRDDVFNPHSGWYGIAQAEIAGRFLGGDNNYNKYILDIRNYIDTGQDTVLALRLMGGIADTMLPEYEKFSVGGVNTLRGYDLSEFEGEQMLVFNAEYRWDIADNTQLVFFGDAGYAWALDEPIRFDDIKFGYGVGLRFDTPLGPIRLDYGLGEEGGQTYFSIGQTF
ncbi:MAG: BamA/TamA family outer membrane protein [Candidatus Atribacteria bacterium]|nr:BamA/TamA family outer membrane protein [Candidatus Atribacteria bacterium]